MSANDPATSVCGSVDDTARNFQSDPLASAHPVPEMIGNIFACTTSRSAGSFGWMSAQPVVDVMTRWIGLANALHARGVQRIATATQVHGAEIVRHGGGWVGTLRLHGFDGHITSIPGTALTVTVADCTPVFLSHPRGVIAALHAGWRGAASGILDAGLDAMASLDCPPSECHVHLGPSICGNCYEVGPEVVEALTGTRPSRHQYIDVRAVLARQAERRGVQNLSVSALCTRCHGDQLYSHRAGDEGRQLGIIALLA